MMIGKVKLLIACLTLVSACASANGDSLRDACYQSMRYNVYVQLAGNAYSRNEASDFEREAMDSGNWQGIDSAETKRMIAMSSGNPSSAQFSMRYQNDESFAKAYSSGYINDCLAHPDKYISR
ncbi:hypothetical protein UXP85_25200 [Enterobacter cloacae]|uniref:hypothetical protein n=1 Tax=Enterobacter cloacae TaxID=550 RepID=UPI0028758450|nr:hypothetical protein [Enterobacter cloacae]MDR9913358.1 hypothetical protein [Enterobacter cloacae subsp. cloacae]MDU2340356.1 hypothetical protein [Enterobacter asburiae]MDU7761421.1 hypothetical protein [Enterobacter asburiae]HDC4544032.1 hypothetical protein [Enterobacter cloacae]